MLMKEAGKTPFALSVTLGCTHHTGWKPQHGQPCKEGECLPAHGSGSQPQSGDAAPSAQVQHRAATLLISVEASPLPDSSSIRGTASALAKVLNSLGVPGRYVPPHPCRVRIGATHALPLLSSVQQECTRPSSDMHCRLPAQSHRDACEYAGRDAFTTARCIVEGFVHLQVLQILLPRLGAQSWFPKCVRA